MPQAAFFATAHKNALLNMLTGYASSMSGQNIGNFSSSLSQVRIYSSPFGDPSVPLDTVGTNLANKGYWGSAIAGTAPLTFPYMPNSAGGTAKWARWDLLNGVTHTYVDGTVSVTGGGGMLIVPSTTFTLNTEVTCQAVMVQPLNNSGTLRMNNSLANALLNAIINDGTLPGLFSSGTTLVVYGGTQPATADTPVTNQPQLGYYNLSLGGSFYGAAGGSASINAAYVGATATQTGTATWMRAQRGTNILDASVGAGGGSDFVMASTSVVSGSALPNLIGGTLTFP